MCVGGGGEMGEGGGVEVVAGRGPLSNDGTDRRGWG